MKGHIEIDIELCKGCELCIDACPQKIIELSKNFNSKGLNFAIVNDMNKCTGCTLCGVVCPEVAITVYREK